METDRKNQLGKKNFNFDSLGASSILGLDREILSKTCFKQLSLKLSQEMLILLFGIKPVSYTHLTLPTIYSV